MAFNKMTTPRKIIKRGRMTEKDVMIVHSCTQTITLAHLEKNVQKLSEIITGNGHPEDGISRKVALIGERQGVMVEKLQAIHDDLVTYHKEVETAKEVALTVKSAFEKYKSENLGVKKGKDEASTQSQVNFNNVISILGTIVIVITLIITIITGRKEDEKLKNQIDNLGTQ